MRFRVLSLVLVMSLVLAGCLPRFAPELESDPPDEGTPAATATETGGEAADAAEATPTPIEVSGEPVLVDALWFSDGADGPEGGTSSVKVEVRNRTSADASDLRVGFFESEVAGTGDQWRASGWMSVITSSLLLGIDPSSYEFSFDVAGRIDGPSAGGLMTVGVLAGFLGDAVKPEVTMTGTINPDGSIGPVGGIPQKLAGAAEAGKTVVLVPAGQRRDYDYALEQMVDVVQVGQSLGIEVQLVSDIYQAYPLLTGNELPQFEADGSELVFPEQATQTMRTKTAEWIARYQEDRGRFDALSGDIQPFYQSLINEADHLANQANQALERGDVAIAYHHSLLAAVHGRMVAENGEADAIFLEQGVGPLRERLDSASSVATRVGEVFEQLRAQDLQTATDAVTVMDAYSSLSVAQGLVSQADYVVDEMLNSSADYSDGEIFFTVKAVSVNYALADLYVAMAKDTVDIGVGFGSAPAPDEKLLTAIAETLRRGAEANINYFDSLIVDPWAQSNGVHPDLATYYFMETDPTYLSAVSAQLGGMELGEDLDNPEQEAVLTLGGALTAYSASSTMLAKYYSLGAELNEEGKVAEYERLSALPAMLDLASRRAESYLQATAEEEPVSALFYYRAAQTIQHGETDDQLTALNYYWQSGILAQVLGIFSGDVGN